MKESTKKLGAHIDALYIFDIKIRKAERELKMLKSSRASEERQLLRAMQDVKLEKAAGTKAQAGIIRRRIPTVKNQAKFQRFVKRYDAFDLYQNRVASKAYFARLEEGQPVPGVEVFEKTSVSIRKRG